jgi:phosphate:Na+ symporter
MKIATTGLRENPGVIEAINHFRGAPLLAFVGTALLTAFVQSSAVVIGIAMTLASHNLISVHDAMYWVYGANVGTTATGIIAAMGGNYVGRQVAWAHFFYKMAGVALFALVTTPFVHLLESLESDPMRSIANAHTFLNLVSAAVFYPFIGYGARLFEKYIQPTASERAFGTKFIKTDSKSLSMAYAQALRETLRMGDIVSGMVRDSILLFQGDDPDLIEDVRKRDSKVDLLFREIKAFW